MRADATGGTGAVLLGLPDFVVLAAGEVELLVQTRATVTGCPGCGVVTAPHGRRPVLVRDLPAAGRPVVLIWSKRLWCCPERLCRQRTWSETHPQLARRAVLTERARRWAMCRVGRHAETVAGVARQLGVGWHTVMRAVRDCGQPLVDDSNRLGSITALGVDEHVWSHAGPRQATGFATGIVDMSAGRPPRLLDLVPGRTGKVYADWLAARDDGWREQVRVAALDPFRGYGTALSHALRVLDAFHVVKLANDAVDETRRRIQQDTLGHRGHKGDPLYQVRRRLRRGVKTPTDRQVSRLDAALAAGDPTGEVALAWQCAQQVQAVYHAPTREQGRRRAHRVLQVLPDPGDRPTGTDAAGLAGRVPRLPRHQRRLERSHRSDQLADRTQPPRRPRLPKLPQLPAATTPQLWTHLEHSQHRTDQNP